MNLNDTPTLTLSADTDCVLYIDGVKKMQLVKGMMHELPLQAGKYMFNFVSLENHDDNRLVEYKMSSKDAMYEVNFQGKVKKKRKAKKIKKIWRILLWIVSIMAILGAVVLGWLVWQRMAPASVEKLANGDLRITVKGVKFIMKPVEGGTFQMGSTDGAEFQGEKIVHAVTVSSFYIGETEVTGFLWKRLMGKTNGTQKNNPQGYVCWYDCQKFIEKLNQETGMKFRLPTEAEWEYAARGGKYDIGYQYAGADVYCNVAWCVPNRSQSPCVVGKKYANALGLYDMSGNVMEWCEDWFDREYYKVSPLMDPKGPTEGKQRVIRGGSYCCPAEYCRVFSRQGEDPSINNHDMGLRLALTPSE